MKFSAVMVYLGAGTSSGCTTQQNSQSGNLLSQAIGWICLGQTLRKNSELAKLLSIASFQRICRIHRS